MKYKHNYWVTIYIHQTVQIQQMNNKQDKLNLKKKTECNTVKISEPYLSTSMAAYVITDEVIKMQTCTLKVIPTPTFQKFMLL